MTIKRKGKKEGSIIKGKKETTIIAKKGEQKGEQGM